MRVILSIASTTVGEAIRRKVLLVILLVGLLLLVIAPSLNVLTARQERSVLIALTLGVIQLTAAVIAVVLTVYLLPNEIERRTIYTILSKPVQRWQFLIGKYLGAISTLGLMLLFMTVVLVGVFAVSQQVYSAEQLAPLVRGPFMFFFQMSLLAAAAMMFSTFVSPIVNIFLSGGLYVLGTLFNPFFQTISESPGVNPVVRGIVSLIHFVIPNFGNFNIQNPLINPGQVLQNELFYYVGTISYGLMYMALLIIAACVIFEYREV